MDKDNQKYSDDKDVWKILAVLAVGLILGIVALVFFVKLIVLPNILAIINWFVPNFWNMFLWIIIFWVIFQILKFIWYPIYSMIGKWSYLILLATLIYGLIQSGVL